MAGGFIQICKLLPPVSGINLPRRRFRTRLLSNHVQHVCELLCLDTCAALDEG